MVATIIRVRGLRSLCVKHFKVNRGGFIILFLMLERIVGGVNCNALIFEKNRIL
jgi:hypothetical protein